MHKRGVKVTFIQPYYHNIWEAIGIGYIASYCREAVPGIQMRFFQGYFDSDETIINGAKDSHVVAFSCTSPAYNHALRLARALKKIKPKIRTVFGGWHPTAIGEDVLVDGVDQVVIGEGEYAFSNVMAGLDDPVVDGYELRFNRLPWPDRYLIKNERTIELAERMTGKRIAAFQAHRGCPYNCIYCSEAIMSQKILRDRDIDDTLNEIEAVRRSFRIDYFKFVDATFDQNPQWVKDFCIAKKDRGCDLEWECMIHPTLATEEMFYWLKEANCNQVNVGCESGSERVLKTIKKASKVDKIKQVFGWAKKHGIKRRAFFIIGIPGETKQDLMMTKQLISDIKPDVYGVTIACPYPGSRLYNHERFKDVNWAKTDEYSNDFWQTAHFSNEQLKLEQELLIDENTVNKSRRR